MHWHKNQPLKSTVKQVICSVTSNCLVTHNWCTLSSSALYKEACHLSTNHKHPFICQFWNLLILCRVAGGLEPISIQLHKGHVAMLSVTSNTCSGCHRSNVRKCVWQAVPFTVQFIFKIQFPSKSTARPVAVGNVLYKLILKLHPIILL